MGRRERVRRTAAVRGRAAPHVPDAAGPVGHPPGRRPREGPAGGGRRLRRRRAARPDHARAAPGWRRTGRGDHARARGGLGGAAGRAHPAAPHRRGHRRGHLPGRVLPGPDLPGALAGGRRPHDATAPGCRRGEVQPRSAGWPRHQGALRPWRPPRRRLRVTPRAAQGPGHAARGLAAGLEEGSGRRSSHRRRRAVLRSPAEFGRTFRAGSLTRPPSLGPLHRPCADRRAPRALRGGRRLRHAVPDQARRAGRGGPRHRLPRGVGDRTAGDRRRFRRRA